MCPWQLAATGMFSLETRGIHVLDVGNGTRVSNFPFLNQHLLNSKNSSTGGGLGRAIRLLKTLKADADKAIEISSYDIAAIAWNMNDTALVSTVGGSFRLANNCSQFLLSLIAGEGTELKKLNVPNQTRKIVDAEGTTLSAVLSLWYELHLLLERIKTSGKSVDREYRLAANSLTIFA